MTTDVAERASATFEPVAVDAPAPEQIQAVIERLGEGQAWGHVRLSTLRKVAFVSSFSAVDPRSTAPDQHGYQRDPMPRRFSAIGKYYRQGGMLTPLFLSVRIPIGDVPEFLTALTNGAVGQIERNWGKAAVSVVDGQHRLGGLARAQDDSHGAYDPQVPVVLFFGLDFADETRLFDTVNATQRALPRALIETSKADITELGEATYQQRLRKVAMSLARDADSPWLGKVDFTGARKGFSFESLRRATGDMLPAEFMSRLVTEGEDPTILAKSYWFAVATTAAEAWDADPRTGPDGEILAPLPYRLHDVVGVMALARLGKDILTSALERKDTAPIPKTIAELVTRLNGVDWEKKPGNDLMAGLAGFSGARALYERLYPVVYGGETPVAQSAEDEVADALADQSAQPGEGDTPRTGRSRRY